MRDQGETGESSAVIKTQENEVERSGASPDDERRTASSSCRTSDAVLLLGSASLEKRGGGVSLQGWKWGRGPDFQNFHGCVVMLRRRNQRRITISEEKEMKRGRRPWRRSSVHPW